MSASFRTRPIDPSNQNSLQRQSHQKQPPGELRELILVHRHEHVCGKDGDQKCDQPPTGGSPQARDQNPNPAGDLEEARRHHHESGRGQIRWHDPLVNVRLGKMRDPSDHKHHRDEYDAKRSSIPFLLLRLMTVDSQNHSRRLVWIAIAVLLVPLAGFAGWRLSRVDHLATGAEQKTITIDCEYGKFRQIMIRKNATAAIVAHGGMTLIDEQVHDLTLDTSRDDRPILNAIRGQSKSDLKAIKEITVSLDDPMLEADRLVLRQESEITETQMTAESTSKEPAGRLKRYQTSLYARPEGDKTVVDLSVELDVLITIPKFLAYKADEGVQEAAVDAVGGQSEALKSFIAKHRDKRMILPDIGS